MNTEMLIAVGLCVLSFLAFRLFFSFLNKNLNVEVPDLLSFIIGLVIITVLYIKREFFFAGNPIVTGVSVGILLSMLWSISGTEFMGKVLGAVISLRFMVWCLAVAGGIYWEGTALGLWNKYIVSGIPQVKSIILIAFVILFILGTVLLLTPEFYFKNIAKSTGFTLNRNVPTTKRVFTQVVGMIIIIICTGLSSEIILFITKLFS